jgi:hypothetical protein
MRRSVVNMVTQATVGDAAEHVVATIYPPVGNSGEGSPIGVLLHSELACNFGASGTSATVKIRKGSISGTTLRTGTIASTGAFMGVLSWFDPGPIAGPYVLTVTVAAQAGAGSVTGYFACDQ